MALPGQPQTLDPTRMIAHYSLPIVTALYDGLLTRDQESGDLSPALATAWRSNADATVWTFTLRRGVKFSDGAEFNAEAAKKSFEYYQNDESLWRFAVGDPAAVRTPDAYTLVVSYDKPFPDLARFAPFIAMISPKLLTGSMDAAKKRVATQASGTGPYILDRFFSTGRVVAHANPDYWGGGPHIEQLDMEPISEESARISALQAGDIDLVMGVSPREAQGLAGDPRLTVSRTPSWTNYLLSFGTQTAPLNDVRVRQAFAWAIDREAIAKGVMLGEASVIDSVMPPGLYGYREPQTKYAYNPEKAKALLAEAGLKQPVKMTIVAYGTVADGTGIAQALAEQAKAGGFDIKVISLPETAAVPDLIKAHRKYAIHLIPIGWINGGPFHYTSGDFTAVPHYDGKKLVDLVNQMSTTADGPARERIIAAALEETSKQLPSMSLFTVTTEDASTSALKDHVPPKDGFDPNWTKQYLAGN
ncbi:MAG: ABC transporter substrate-binding protein [Conexibacter sp.]